MKNVNVLLAEFAALDAQKNVLIEEAKIIFASDEISLEDKFDLFCSIDIGEDNPYYCDVFGSDHDFHDNYERHQSYDIDEVYQYFAQECENECDSEDFNTCTCEHRQEYERFMKHCIENNEKSWTFDW